MKRLILVLIIFISVFCLYCSPVVTIIKCKKVQYKCHIEYLWDNANKKREELDIYVKDNELWIKNPYYNGTKHYILKKLIEKTEYYSETRYEYDAIDIKQKPCNVRLSYYKDKELIKVYVEYENNIIEYKLNDKSRYKK